MDSREKRDDVTAVDAPSDRAGYVAGNRRATPGAMEEERGVLMLFANKRGEPKGKGRGGSEMLAMSASAALAAGPS